MGSGDVEKSEENIHATETVDLNDKVEDKIASIDENEDKPVIQLKKRGRKPKVKTSKKRQKKINHQSGPSKTTEIEHLEEPKIEMNGVEESEAEPSDIPVTPKRRSTIATDTSIETKKPESAAKSNQCQQRRKSIHNVLQKLNEHSENVIETVDTNDDPTAKEAIENTQAEVLCKTEDEGLEKPIETENPPKSSRPHRRSSFAASFYLSGSTDLEDEILSKRSLKRKQSSSPQDQPKPTVNNEVIEEPSKETNEVNKIEEDEEEKPIVHLKKRKRKSPTLESEPQIVKSSDVSNLENTEKPFMDENQPIKPRQRSESEKIPPKKRKRRKKNHDKEKQFPVEKSDKNEAENKIEITPSNNGTEELLTDTATPKLDTVSVEHNKIVEASNEPKEGDDDDQKPKRRSSFAASFYSALPKSERSLRRSNGRVNYFEDIKDEIEESEGSPIRRKKPHVKEITESLEPTRIDTDESISDSAG